MILLQRNSELIGASEPVRSRRTETRWHQCY